MANKYTMKGNELAALKALGIPTRSWDNGQTHRVKVRGKSRDVYVGSLTSQNIKKIASYYRVPIDKLTTQLNHEPNQPHQPTKLYRKPSLSPHERSALQQLRIPTKAWDNGQTRRVKVHSNGRDVYVSKLTPSNIQKIAKYHSTKKFPEHKLATLLTAYLDPSYVRPKQEDFERVVMNTKEYLRYRNIEPGAFYDKLEQALNQVDTSLRFHISLGYVLVSDVDEYDEVEWHPSDNTRVSTDPFRIYRKRDITNIVSEIRAMELADKIDTSGFGSSYKIKYIDSFDVEIFYLQHKLGAEIAIPKAIKDNRYVINFAKTDNKCVFHCIAYHRRPDMSIPPHRIIKYVKAAFKQWCEFNGQKFSMELYRNCQPIDMLEFDRLEECFQLNINTFAYKKGSTTEEELVPHRRSEATYEDTLNILHYKGHAMYVTNADRFIALHQCPKCDMMFACSKRLSNHTKNKCQIEQFERFIPDPAPYRPQGNSVQYLLELYKVQGKVPDHFMDDFIAFDFESILRPIDESRGDATKYIAQHQAVSVSITNTLDYQVRCFVAKDVKELLEEMMEYIQEIAFNVREAIKKKFAPLFRAHELHHLKVFYPTMDKELARKTFTGTQAEWDACTIGNDTFDVAEQSRFLKASKRIHRMLDVPVLGFNSGRYDINLVRDHLFEVLEQELAGQRETQANDEKKKSTKLQEHAVTSVIKGGNGYMCLSTKQLKFLDISNYCAADTGSLAKYIPAYSGTCSCKGDEQITCLCPVGKKEHFPYEYVTSYEILNMPGVPPRWTFDDHKKGSKISDKDYARVEFIWNHFKMQTLKDYLIWFNNSDCVPFARAIKGQQAFFRKKGLDMFHDGVSLPGLAERLMYQNMYESLKPIPKVPGNPFSFPNDRFKNYVSQDKKAERECTMTLPHVDLVLYKQQHMCALCYRKLTVDDCSVDRLDNGKGHTNDNIQVTCINCNRARGEQDIKRFRYKKMLEYNADKLIWSIDKEYKHIYHTMRSNICGGPAIIFHRYAKRGVTHIRNGEKVVAIVIRLDCNALYPYAFGVREMPCGRLTTIELYDGLIEDIIADKLLKRLRTLGTGSVG